tara:strand:+ start:601 stop:864 length:264 start_codon:yes stop_codon:yes gene_type:complete
MKYRALRIIASSITVLVWVVVAIGVVASVMVGIGAVTAVAKIAFLLGGLVFTAIGALMLLMTSRLIYLLVDMEEDLSRIADIIKEKK